MGFIAKEQHDVFFSYATLDNDLQSNWVKDFREDLKTRVLLELKAIPGFKELEWFSSRFSSIERQALAHMFMLMLTRSAVREASAGKLGEIKSKARYESVFDEKTGAPIGRLLPT